MVLRQHLIMYVVLIFFQGFGPKVRLFFFHVKSWLENIGVWKIALVTMYSSHLPIPLLVQYYKQNKGKVTDNYFTLFPQKEEFDEEELELKVPQLKVEQKGRRVYYNFNWSWFLTRNYSRKVKLLLCLTERKYTRVYSKMLHLNFFPFLGQKHLKSI